MPGRSTYSSKRFAYSWMSTGGTQLAVAELLSFSRVLPNKRLISSCRRGITPQGSCRITELMAPLLLGSHLLKTLRTLTLASAAKLGMARRKSRADLRSMKRAGIAAEARESFKD